MFFHFRSWLRRNRKRLSGEYRGTTIRLKQKRRPCGLRSLLEHLEPRVTPALTSFSPGALIIDMGQPTQTVGNALKPYGLVYDMVTNFKVPVDWAINPDKTAFRLDPADPIPVDFTATITTGTTTSTKSYSGGSFIIEPGFLTPAVIADINTWKAQGVVVDTLAAPLTTDIYGQVTSFPRAVLDAQNGKLAVPYYTNAGVPASSYVIGNPTDLTTCNDIYILPHADPDQWPALWRADLLNFIATGGSLWAGCHAVSVIENSTVSGAGSPQLNFLSNAGLVPFGSHGNGTPPYSYNPAAANDPEMQIMNRLDAATQNGSEQIYVPTAAGWRGTTTVATFDPDHPQNPPGGTSPFNKAAVIAYGHAFGDPANGMVMYEAGHSLSGTAPANIAAQRAFFNFLLTVGIARAPQGSVSVPSIQAGRPATITATITGGDGNYKYQWVSTNGGVFSVPAGTATAGQTITTQYLLTRPTDTIRLVITDTPCGRQGIASVNVAIPPPVIDLDADDSSGATGADFHGTFAGGTAVPAADTDTTITDEGSPTISSAVIRLTNRPDGPAETLLIDTTLAASFGIGVQPDGSGGFVLTGTATLAQYQEVIATLQYFNSLAFPNTEQRVITVVVNDGVNNSNTATSRLDFAGGSATTVPKELYLNQPGQGMNRVDPVAHNQTTTSSVPMIPVVSPNSTGMATWTNRQTQDLVYAPWQFTAFGTPAVQRTDGGSYIVQTTAASKQRNEAIMIGVTSDQHVSGAVWNGTVWTPIAINVGGKVTQNLGKPSDKKFWGAAVAYETASGNVVLVWNTGKALDYSIWDGTSWTPAAVVPTTAFPAGVEPRQIRLASNPLLGSNEIVMVVTDRNEVDRALVWNGTSWGNAIQLDNNTGHNFTDVNVAYEQQDGRAVVVYASGTAGAVGYRIWDGSTWSAAATISPPTTGTDKYAQWTAVASDPNSNRIVLGVQTNGNDAWVDVWDGTAWGTATLGVSNGVTNQNNQNIAVAFESKSGDALAVYENNEGTNTNELQYRTFDGTNWSAGTNFYPDNNKTSRSLTLTSNPYSDQVMLMVNDDAKILKADLWSGTAFGAPTQLQPYPGSTSDTNTTDGQPFSFFWDSFLPGTVTTETTFTQTEPMTSPFVMPAGGEVKVTTYIEVTGGTFPSTPDLSVSLSQAGRIFISIQGPPTVIPEGGNFYELVWTGTMSNNVTVPTGGQIALTYTDFDTAYSFDILYGSETDPSQVQVATATAVTVNSLGVFDAPFPGGSPVAATPAGQPAFVRFTVSDPFGASDITSADLNITNSAGGSVFSETLTDADVVAETAGSKTYEIPWTPPVGDTFTLTVIAHEGTEGVTATRHSTVTATAAPDLVVTKSDGGATVDPGGTVAYTIDYANVGLALATGVVLTEFLPPGSTFDAAASTPGWTAIGTTAFQFTVGSLTPGDTGSVVFAVTVSSPVPAALEQLVNTVNIADDGTHGADTNPDNNSATVGTPVNAAPDLVVTKTDRGTSTRAGGIVLYQITYANIGTQDANGVVITETLPADTTFNSEFSDPAWDTEGDDQFSLNVGDLPVGASATVTFAVTVDSPLPPGVTQIVNTVSIDDGHTSGPDLNPDNNTATDTTPIANNPEADLRITKTDNVTTVTPGSVVTYTITVTNAGPDDVTGATLTDDVPPSLSGVSFTSVVSGGATTTPGGGTGNHISASLDLPVGGTVVYTVTGTLDPHAAAGTLTNLATVLPPAGITDPNTGNNTAIDQNTVVPVSDLAVNKSFTFTDLDGSGTLTPGDRIVFAVTVTNHGPSVAQNVSVLDLLPNGYRYVSDDARLNGGTYSQGTGLWTIGTIGATAPDNTAVLHITAVVGPAGGSYTNTAAINTSDSSDPDTGNNSFTVTPPVQPASDLTLSKTMALTHDNNGNGVINIGDQVMFTLALTNLGPDPAANVHVADHLPAGYAFVSATPSQGTFTSGTGDWNVGTVTVLSTQTLRIVATVVGNQPDGAYTNSAQASSDSFDPTPENNHASVTPFIADLSVTKAAGLISDNDESGTLTVGDTVRFTVTVTNAGPDFATGVQLVDLLTAGFTYVSDDSGGTYDPTTGLWNVGVVAPGTTLTLTITADVNPSGPYTNTAQVTAGDQFDPNSTPNNNVPTENDQATVTITLQAALTDLAVTKAVSDAAPNVGETITFTVTLTNNGPSNATNVTVQDILPTGLTFVAAAPSPGTYNPATGIWTVGTVTTATPLTLTIRARVDSPNPLTNTAALSHLDQFDSDSSNNSASVVVTPQRADLAVSKTVSDARPNLGETVTFTISLTNLGPDAATNVTVEDLLPAGLTFDEAVPSNGTFAGGVWTIATVNPGPFQILTLTITATVTGPSPATNTATITHADQFDPNDTNNTASVTTTPQRADLQVLKGVSDPTPNVGDTVTFTIALANLGPDAATGVTVQDLLPAGLEFDSATPSQGTYTIASGVWAVGTVNPGHPLTLTITATVTSPDPAINTAEVTHSDQFDPNTANNRSIATVVPPRADLALAKTVSDETPNVGETITFTVTLTNNGPGTATNVSVSDALPAGLTLVTAAPSRGTYAGGVWTVGPVAPGIPLTLTLTATVVSPDPQTNTATIAHSDQFDPDEANNTADATATPQLADLGLAKTVSDTTPNVGDTITFTVTLTNDGPDAATNVTVGDLLPEGLTFVSATPSQGTYDTTSGVWTVGTVTTTTPQTLTLVARVVSPDPRANTATITHSDQYDPDGGNNQAGITQTPQRADLALSKSVSDTTPNLGDTITFAVALRNAGPDAATNVQVTDLLPAGLAFVDATPSQGTYTSATGLWTVGTVTRGAAATLEVVAVVDSTGTETNTAMITHADQFDPDTGNNQASATETTQRADLVVGKMVSNPTPNVGDTITYTISVTNDGPDIATNAVVHDTLPPQVRFSFFRGVGIYDPATGTWTIGTLAVNETVTLTITALVVSPNPLANTASISHSDQFDPNPDNNRDTASINPLQADLELGKTVSDATPNVGGTITFTVTLTNNGPNDATNVTVEDTLPGGLALESVVPSEGTYAAGVWTLATVAAGTEETLTFMATVVGSTAQTNTATITHSDQFDPDPGNDSADATVTPQRADLQVTKSVSDATPNVGDTVTFTIALANLGPDAATNVTVQDLLPAGLTLLAFSPSRGDFDPITRVWDVDTVDPSAAQTLTLTALVVSPGPETNTATITHADQFDPDDANNSDTATVTPLRADLAVTKVVSNPTPNVGDTITFTVRVTNNGPDPATGVAVTDPLPPGLELVSATPSQGAYAGGVWTVGTIDPSATATLTITVVVRSPEAETNKAEITHADQFDPDEDNNSDTATETPLRADLAIDKSVSDATPNVGQTIIFTINLTNFGPNTATGVEVTDLLPPGMTFVEEEGQGTYSSEDGVWTVGTVEPGSPLTLTITAVVTSPNPATNTAEVTHEDEFDPDETNNTATVTVTPQQADLDLTKTVSNARPNVGDNITFTVTLRNIGPDTATNVAVSDLLPPGMLFVSATLSEGTYDSATGAWTLSTVTTTTPQTLTLIARVVIPDEQENTATISRSDQFDPDDENNTATATVTPQQADLALAKTVSNPTPNVGETITYTISLTNNGPDPATNVTVTDVLQPGVVFLSADPSQGTYSTLSGVWAVGTVDPEAAPLTLTITAVVTSPNPATNTAEVSRSDQFDPDEANNRATAETSPLQADLELGKTVSDPRPNVGGTITYTVTLTNNGPNDATNVTVHDTLPGGLALVSVTESAGAYAAGVWTLAAVPAGTAQTLTFVATVVGPAAQTNTATITHSDQSDPNTGNNTAEATTTPQRADLELAKTVSDATPNVGDTVTFTIALANLGPDAATGVTVDDLLPAGLALVSATPSQGGYNAATGVWIVGTVTTAAAPTLVIRATVVSPDRQTNTADISHADQFDPDEFNDTADAIVTPQQADLALVKTVSDLTPNVGDTIAYTVILTNSGPDAATGVTIDDLLPAGLSLVSATSSVGSYSGVTGVWTVGTLPGGGSAVLTLNARVVGPAAQTNTATITHSDQFDPDTGNNTAEATATPQQADLAVAKSVNDLTPNVGETITFTVTLTNTGPNDATNVTVTDLLPAGLTFITATPSEGEYSNDSGIWVVGTVTTGTPETLQIEARVDSPAAQTNTATITAADQFDPDGTNNSDSATTTPQQADLAIAKTVSDATPNVGDVITYTVTLTNIGPGSASSVTVSDTLPPGLSFVSFTASQGSYDSVTGLWTVGDIAASAALTLEIRARAESPAAQTNTAAVSNSDQFDPNPGNNSASTTETPQQADLAVTKSVSDATPNVGDVTTFTITLTNTGPDAATNVAVTDLIPGGLTFVSATPSQGTYSSATGLWAVGTVPAATPETLTIEARVVSPGSETNTATITAADQFDPNPGDNSASATTTPQQADLAVGKSVSDPTPNVGDTITYTVVVTNNGPDPATGVTVQDSLPAGLTFVSAATTAGSYDPGTGVWAVGIVVPGAPQTLTITATVTSPGIGANTATISHSDQFDPNPDNNSNTASTNPQAADLAVAKSVSDATPNVGDTITFTVTLTNSGPSSATGVTVTDLLPAGLGLVAATPSQGSYDAATGTWTVGAVANGGQAVLRLRAVVVGHNIQTNAAAVSHADQFDPDTANNSDTATATPQQADLQVSKTVSNTTPNVGDTITFTVALRNLGPDAATGVTVTDLLPAGLGLVAATPSQGSYDAATGTWTVGTVDLSAARTLTLVATVVSPDARTNTAAVGHADQFDPDTANNTASATATPQQADLVLAKSVSDAAPNVGDTITFTVILANLGPDAATNVAVTDLLPAGLGFVTATPGLGMYNSGTGLWSVGTLAGGSNATLTIEARVVSPAARTNTATISHSDQFDPNTGNNTASTTETPQAADPALAKTTSDPTPNAGDTITFTITLTNNGPDAATGVTVTDPLPPGLNLIGATPSEGTYNPVTGVWTVGTVNPGAPQTLQFQVLVVSPTAQTNTATISHADQFDPDATNNQSSATASPQQADLVMSKAVSDPTPNVGDTVTFTVTLSNSGPDSATSVTVTDLIPPGLAFVAATPGQGTYTSTTGLWAVGTVAANASLTLLIEARVVSPDAQTNVATVSHADQFDPNPGDNSAAATATPQQADLLVTKSVDDPTPNVGDTITYTITVTNTGPDTATDVVVRDTLPHQVRSRSSSASQGGYDPATGTWTVGTLAVGETATLTITVLVADPNPQANTATITHSDQFDPNTGNNTASTAETPQQADLALGKSVSDPRPNVGGTITFTVTLTNVGPNTATNVTVGDALPPGLELLAATESQGSYDSITGLWNVGDVTPGAALTLELVAEVMSPNAQTNTAVVTHADQFDPNPGNNSAAATETPQQADLALSKSVNDPTPNVGNTVTFTIVLANLGPDAATNVTVEDLLPAGLTFDSAEESQGTYTSATGVWAVGIVEPGTPLTLTITATVTSPNPSVNTAAVNHSDQFDPDTANDTGTAPVTPQLADLRVSKSVSDAAPNVGDTITFTVTLSNSGPDAATNVSVTDLLPAGLGFVADTPSQGSYNSATGIWTVNTVSPFATTTLQIQALVVSPDARMNTARVSHSDQFDPDTADNSDSATETPQQADVAVAKSVSDPTPNVGDTITFTVTLTNTGPDSATNVAVNDLLPAGLGFVSATPSQGIYNSGTGVWAVGTVAVGGAQTLLIRGRVVSPDAQTNTAEVSHSDQFDPDTGNNTGTATETPQRADLAVGKSVSDPTPNVGDTITYTVTLTNTGPDAATSVTLVDALPAGLTFVSATPGLGTYNSLTGLWTVGTVAANASVSLLIQARVDSPDPLTNTATVNHADQFDPNTGNNSASTTETPQVADLALVKTVSNPTPNVGDTITFTVTLTNNGPAAASGVQVTDPLPPGLSLVTATPSQGSYTSGRLWDVGALASGATATLTLTAKVVSPLAQTNTATITHADQFDPNLGNNSAGATARTLQADLALAKIVNNPTPNLGDTVTFTITLTSNGPNAATNVRVADLLPAGLVFTSATPSQGSYDSGTGVWDVGMVVAGTSLTLQIQARLVGLSAEANTATISHADQFDPNPGNNTATATVTPPVADLAVTKTVDQPQTVVDTVVTYTSVVTNHGPDSSADVVLSDPLPPGLNFVSATATQGGYDPATGLWAVGTLPDGVTATLQVMARVAVLGTVLNTATVSSGGVDPDLSNNRSDVTLTAELGTDTISKRLLLASTAAVGGNLLPLAAVPLPPPAAGSPVIAVGAGPGNVPLVRVFDRLSGQLRLSFLAYDRDFRGGVYVALADLTGDGVPDIITGVGVGGGPNVRVFDGRTGALVRSFFAYEPTFTGGVTVAAGDVTGDGVPDIITGTGPGGGPVVAVFDGVTGDRVRTFSAYAPDFRGGVNVAVGDVTGDGVDDIITGAGDGGGPEVRVFDGLSGAEVRSFFAFESSFRNGVSVAAGDMDGDGLADIVAGPGPGGGPVVGVFGGATGESLQRFFTMDPGFRGGVWVAAADADESADRVPDIVTGAGPGGGPRVDVLDGLTGAPEDNFFAFNPAFPGGVTVAVPRR